MHPATGNQGWSLRNIDRAHRKLISKYLPESEITAKGHLYQHKKRPAAAAAANVTPLATEAGEKKSEGLLQLFDSTEKNMS